MIMKILFQILLLISLFSSLVSSLNASSINSNSPICGNDVEDVLFINSQSDLDLVGHCQIFNSSIFISGGYNIDTLAVLSNLEIILGYLVIIDSYSLKNLFGLHNVREINGKELYINDYDVVIRHNRDSLNLENGLCYANKVNWTLISSNEEEWITDNAINCPNCDMKCNGCWGPGPQLCQKCINYRSGITCVDDCPIGTNETERKCIERLPGIPKFSGEAKSLDSIELNFIARNITNGIMLGYEMMRDNEIYKLYEPTRENYDSTYNLSFNLLENGIPNYKLDIFDLIPYTLYNFSMRILNSIGWGNYTDLLLIRTREGYPPIPAIPNVKLIGNVININIQEVSNIYGPIIKYILLDIENTIIYNGTFIKNINITDIISDKIYSYKLEVYTNQILKSESNYSETILWKERENNNIYENENNDYLLYIWIGSGVLGFLLCGGIIYKIINKRRNRERRNKSRSLHRLKDKERVQYLSSHCKNPLYRRISELNLFPAIKKYFSGSSLKNEVFKKKIDKNGEKDFSDHTYEEIKLKKNECYIQVEEIKPNDCYIEVNGEEKLKNRNYLDILQDNIPNLVPKNMLIK